MVPTFIIIFREVLEMALILSIVLAATRGVAGRNLWVWLGIMGGVAGSALVAYFADKIADFMEGMGQEVFNACVLMLASAMITWTVVWMSSHGRQMAQRIKHIGHKVSAGELPLYAIASVVALSMWREGAEIVLFMHGILSTTTESLMAISFGALGGFLSAGVIGLLLYFGLVKLSAGRMFSFTGSLLVLLACGMSAQAAGYLSAAGMLPELVSPLWDSSWLLTTESIPGMILHSLIGYTEQPSGMQAIWYAVTLAIILGLLRMNRNAHAKPAPAKAAAQGGAA